MLHPGVCQTVPPFSFPSTLYPLSFSLLFRRSLFPLPPPPPPCPLFPLFACRYEHPLYGRRCPVVVGGDYITTESGTGLVHTAPGHGQEDYQTGLKCGLPLISPVDDAGRFTEEAGEEFVGQNVLGEGNVAVMQALDRKAALVLEEAYGEWRDWPLYSRVSRAHNTAVLMSPIDLLASHSFHSDWRSK